MGNEVRDERWTLSYLYDLVRRSCTCLIYVSCKERGREVSLMERFGMQTRWNWVGFYGLVIPGTHYSPLNIAITYSFPRVDTPRDLGALERERRRRRRRRKAAYTKQTLWTGFCAGKQGKSWPRTRWKKKTSWPGGGLDKKQLALGQDFDPFASPYVHFYRDILP